MGDLSRNITEQQLFVSGVSTQNSKDLSHCCTCTQESNNAPPLLRDERPSPQATGAPHCVGFARSCLSIGQDRCVKPLEEGCTYIKKNQQKRWNQRMFVSAHSKATGKRNEVLRMGKLYYSAHWTAVAARRRTPVSFSNYSAGTESFTAVLSIVLSLGDWLAGSTGAFAALVATVRTSP